MSRSTRLTFCFFLRFVALPLVVSVTATDSIHFIFGAITESFDIGSQLRSCFRYWSFLGLSRRICVFYAPFFESNVRFLLLLSLVSAYLLMFPLIPLVLAHISALSCFERSFRTFYYNFVSFPSFYSDFCDSDDYISSGHVHIFP